MNNNILISFILLTNCALRFSNLHVVTCSCLLGMQNMATSSTTKSGKTLDPKVRVHMLKSASVYHVCEIVENPR